MTSPWPEGTTKGGGPAPAPPGPKQPATKPGYLVIAVTSSKSGKPVEGAEVRLTGPKPAKATSSNAGKAEFSDLTPGSYKVDVTAAQFSPGSGNTTISPGKTTNASLKLKPNGRVVSVEWVEASAWCSATVNLKGTFEGEATEPQLKVTITPQELPAASTKVTISGASFNGTWQVLDQVPPRAGFPKEVPVHATVAGVKTLKPLMLKFAPDAKKNKYDEKRHHFELSAKDFKIDLHSDLHFVKGWGASVVKLGGAVPSDTGGLLDGAFGLAGYRWMKQDAGKNKYWNGKEWTRLPKGFKLEDANNFCVGFYAEGDGFVCQYGGKWPEKFTDWDVNAADKKNKLTAWENNIRTTWSSKFDLVSKDCKSKKKGCCRYGISASVKFVSESAFKTGVLIIADGNIRSNDQLLFFEEPRIAMAAHEFGHHIGNPDEYKEADKALDKSLNTDGAVAGVDKDSIMGQNLTKVKARHLTLIAKVFSDMLTSEYGKPFTMGAIAV